MKGAGGNAQQSRALVLGEPSDLVPAPFSGVMCRGPHLFLTIVRYNRYSDVAQTYIHIHNVSESFLFKKNRQHCRLGRFSGMHSSLEEQKQGKEQMPQDLLL